MLIKQKNHFAKSVDTKKFHVSILSPCRNWGLGIGDTIAGLFAVTGLQEKYPEAEITYYTNNVDWAKLGWQNSKDINQLPQDERIYHLSDYPGELRKKCNRIEDYCSHVDCEPVFPKTNFRRDFRVHARHKRYVVLAPFTAWSSRQWPLSHWLYLECLIRENLKLDTVVLDGLDRIKIFQGYCYWGQKPEIVANVFHHAACVIANDSMAAHLGGLVKAKTLAIHSSLPSAVLFKHYPTVRSIEPREGECKSCFFDYAKGYRSGCDHGCFSLAGITPQRVLEEIECSRK